MHYVLGLVIFSFYFENVGNDLFILNNKDVLKFIIIYPLMQKEITVVVAIYYFPLFFVLLKCIIKKMIIIKHNSLFTFYQRKHHFNKLVLTG